MTDSTQADASQLTSLCSDELLLQLFRTKGSVDECVRVAELNLSGLRVQKLPQARELFVPENFKPTEAHSEFATLMTPKSAVQPEKHSPESKQETTD
jgi:hypothetical protein